MLTILMRSHSSRVCVVLTLSIGALSIVGCSACNQTEPASRSIESSGRAQDDRQWATVEGRVLLDPASAIPPWPSSLLIEPPTGCESQDPRERPPVFTDSDHNLWPIAVVATGQAGSDWPRTPDDGVLRSITVRNCRLDPLLITTSVGDTVRITNETDIPYFPAYPNAPMTSAVYRENPAQFPILSPGYNTMYCGFGGGCGVTVVVSFQHPVHTTTTEHGRYTLRVPAGQELTIDAVHPLFDNAPVTFTLGAGERRVVDLTIRGQPIVEAPPDPNRLM